MLCRKNQLKSWLSDYKKNPDLAFDIVAPINHDYQKWAVESLQRGLLDIERSKGTLTVKPKQDRLPNIKQEVESFDVQLIDELILNLMSDNFEKSYYPNLYVAKIEPILAP